MKTTKNSNTRSQAKLKVKTGLKAGILALNHNQTLAPRPSRGLKVRTSVRSGIASLNHNQTLVR
jgi:hypothetical protein